MLAVPSNNHHKRQSKTTERWAKVFDIRGFVTMLQKYLHKVLETIAIKYMAVVVMIRVLLHGT